MSSLCAFVLASSLSAGVSAQTVSDNAAEPEERESAGESVANEARIAADQGEVYEVVVRGEPERSSSYSVRDPNVASVQVRGEALRQPGNSSADILERVPGVQVSRSGGRADLATASIRGATAAQVPVYLAGLRLNDDVTGTADLSTIPLWMLDRVEIFRGNAPASADRLGLGGAIFFEPRRAKGQELTLGSELGSHAHRALWLLGSVAGQKADGLMGVRVETAENAYSFIDDGGTRFDPADDRLRLRRNADYYNMDIWTVNRLRPSSSARVTSVLNAYSREQGVTGLSVIPAQASRAQITRLLMGLSSQLECSSAPDTCQIELSTSALSASQALSDPLRELSLGTTHVSSEGTRLSQGARLDYTWSEALRFSVSGEQAHERLHIDNLGSSSLRLQRLTSRGALSLNVLPLAAFSAPELGVHVLGALECHTTRGAGPNEACGVLEPAGRLGLSYDLSASLKLLGNISRYIRNPTLAEMYGISPLVRGNSDLSHETGTSADAGFRWSPLSEPGARLYFDLFVFQREAERLIAYRQSSLGVIRPFNVGEAQLRGLEALANTQLFSMLRAEAHLTLLDPRDSTEGREVVNDVLPYRSRLVAGGDMEIYTRKIAFLPNLGRAGLGVKLLHRASRFADPAGLIVIPSSTVVSLEASTDWLDETFRLRAQLQNVFDSQRFDTVGLPLPGRLAFLSAEVSL